MPKNQVIDPLFIRAQGKIQFTDVNTLCSRSVASVTLALKILIYAK